jgi:hypothetical protein
VHHGVASGDIVGAGQRAERCADQLVTATPKKACEHTVDATETPGAIGDNHADGRQSEHIYVGRKISLARRGQNSFGFTHAASPLDRVLS